MRGEQRRDIITVLGIGNILQTDEGVGVRVVQELDECYHFPDNVDIVDGGVLGLSLISVIEGSDILIVVDAVKFGGPPGELYRFPWEEINSRVRYKDSLHQIDFIETMAMVPLIAKVPRTIVVGVEPQDIETWGLSMTPAVESRLPDLCRMVLDELALLGIEPVRREERKNVSGRTRPSA